MLTISERSLTLIEFYEIVFGQHKVEIEPTHLARIRKNHEFLKVYSKDKIIYGVNTGFGPMAQHIISAEDLNQLQYNLIRSHASGSGQTLDESLCRAVCLTRLMSLSQAYSGIHESTVNLLCQMLNEKISPQIFEHGGVGASGDLTQLAHLALSMIGEGHVYHDGEIKSTEKVFKDLGIKALDIHMREGLSLINGTSAMTAIGLANIIDAKRLMYWQLVFSAMMNEISDAYDDHHSVSLNGAKKHDGQKEIAAWLRNNLADSKRTKNRYGHLQNSDGKEDVLEEKLQEYYSIRCVPQILGPIKQTIEQAEAVLIAELNSANDNPIIDDKEENVFHGGNFHGDYISFEMDKIKIAITKLTMLCERQINFLMNHKINDKLTPFINLGKLGLNFGLQGMQFTATSTTAESQTLSFPMYVHSIPTNNDNQDIVSMGANSALIARKVITNSFEVLAIGLMSAIQAVDYLKIKDQLSSITKSNYDQLRSISELIIEDKPRYSQMKSVSDHLKSKDYQEILKEL